MPRKQGIGKKDIAEKIKEMLRSGKKPKQVATAAFQLVRASGKKKRTKGLSVRAAAIKKVRRGGPLFPDSPIDPRD